jgi:hypothetical protein
MAIKDSTLSTMAWLGALAVILMATVTAISAAERHGDGGPRPVVSHERSVGAPLNSCSMGLCW